MAIGTPIDEGTNGSTTAGNTLAVSTNGTVADDMLLVPTVTGEAATAHSVTDDASNSYTQDLTDAAHASGDMESFLYRSSGTTALANGEDVDLSFTTNANRTMGVIAVSGCDTSATGPNDSDVGEAGWGTSTYAASVTPTSSDEKIVIDIIFASIPNRTPTWGSGYTQILSAQTNTPALYAAYKIVTSTSTESPTVTMSAPVHTTRMLAVYDGAGAGAFTLTADGASYTLTGSAAGLEYHSLIDAIAASYALTGQAANLEYHSVLSADGGSYAWAGQDASLIHDSVLSADSASYAWTGQDATLTHSGGATILNAESGSYTWTGQDASLEYHSLVNAENGSYIWTGQDANLEYDSILAADSGSYAWAGQDASLVFTSVLNAESGSYMVSGSSASLIYSAAPPSATVPYEGFLKDPGKLIG